MTFPFFKSKTAQFSALLNSVSAVGSRAIMGLARLAVLLLIARVYGPSDFGQLALAISCVEIFRTFAEFGIDTISIARFSRASQSEQSALMGRLLATKLLLSGVFYVLCIFVLGLIARDRYPLMLGAVAGCSLLFSNVAGVFSSYLQSQLAMSRNLGLAALSMSGYVVCAGAAAYLHSPLIFIVALLPVAEAVYCVLLSRECGRVGPLTIDWRETANIVKESVPLGLMGAMIILYFRLDNLVLFRIAGEVALAQYALVCRIVEPALMVPQAFATTLYVVLSKPSGDDHKGLIHHVGATMWPAYLFMLVAAMIVGFGAPIILQYAAPKFGAAAPLMRIMAFVLLVRTANVTSTAILNSMRRYRTLAWITASNLAINAIAAVGFVSSWGAIGGAWAALVTESWNAGMQGRAILTASDEGLKTEPVVAGVDVG